METQAYPCVTVAGAPEFVVIMRCGHCRTKNKVPMAIYRDSMCFKCTSCKKMNLYPERP